MSRSSKNVFGKNGTGEMERIESLARCMVLRGAGEVENLGPPTQDFDATMTAGANEIRLTGKDVSRTIRVCMWKVTQFREQSATNVPIQHHHDPSVLHQLNDINAKLYIFVEQCSKHH